MTDVLDSTRRLLIAARRFDHPHQLPSTSIATATMRSPSPQRLIPWAVATSIALATGIAFEPSARAQQPAAESCIRRHYTAAAQGGRARTLPRSSAARSGHGGRRRRADPRRRRGWRGPEGDDRISARSWLRRGRCVGRLVACLRARHAQRHPHRGEIRFSYVFAPPAARVVGTGAATTRTRRPSKARPSSFARRAAPSTGRRAAPMAPFASTTSPPGKVHVHIEAQGRDAEEARRGSRPRRRGDRRPSVWRPRRSRRPRPQASRSTSRSTRSACAASDRRAR